MLLRSLELLSGPYMEAAAVTVSEPGLEKLSLCTQIWVRVLFGRLKKKNKFHENILSVNQVAVEVKVGG